MRSFTKCCAVLLPIAASVILAGCSSNEPGKPSPQASVQPTAPSSSAPPTSAPAAGDSLTAALAPCSLLTASDLTQFGAGFGAGVEGTLAGARKCDYQQPSKSASEPGLNISVGIRDAQGVKDAQDAGSGVQKGSVAGREAVQIPSGTRSCILAIAVGETSRVDVVVTGSTAKDSCDIASKVADVVEARLPKA